MLDAPLIVQRYSRLVVDCNRPFAAPDCFPEVSDGTIIPANAGFPSESDGDAWTKFTGRFHRDARRTCSTGVPQRGGGTILVAVHSFTPRLVGGRDRPWQLGVLSNRDGSFAERFLIAFRRANTRI